ncbi:hypothetical protein KDL45_15985 [bacterium]|nr:hypothetical protein [bacterium]MCB9476572.1 hypothetical protein [Deltaproteobacteria bacterium]
MTIPHARISRPMTRRRFLTGAAVAAVLPGALIAGRTWTATSVAVGARAVSPLMRYLVGAV